MKYFPHSLVQLTTNSPLCRCLLRCIIVLLLSPAALAVAAEQSQKLQLTQPLKVAFTEFKPYSYTDDDGVARGYFVEVIQKLLDELALPYTMISRPTARIYHQLKLGELDIWLGPIGVPTLQEHIFEIPLPERFSVNLCLWRQPGTPDAHEVLDLQGQSLAVINGFTYSGLIKQLSAPEYNIQLHSTSSHENAFKMLISARVDYLLDYEQPVNVLLEQHPEVRLHKLTVQNRKLGFMVSRHSNFGQSLFEAISSATHKHYPAISEEDI